MVIGKKFWPIKATTVDVSYSPSSRPGTNTGGIINGTTSITGVDSVVVTAVNALIGSSTAGVGLTGQWIAPGTYITAASGTTLTLSKPTGAAAGAMASLTYWDLDYPSVAGGDTAINALFCNASTKFEFYDASGKLVTFNAGKLVVGAVYYFEILTVKTCANAGDYIGYSAQ